MKTVYLFTIGAISECIACESVWLTTPALLQRAKADFAKRHGLSESGVWTEARKNPDGTRVQKEIEDCKKKVLTAASG